MYTGLPAIKERSVFKNIYRYISAYDYSEISYLGRSLHKGRGTIRGTLREMTPLNVIGLL